MPFLEVERNDSGDVNNCISREGKELLAPAKIIQPVSETMVAYIETIFSEPIVAGQHPVPAEKRSR